MYYTNVTNIGNNICFLGRDENGKRIKYKEQFKPRLFVKDQKGTYKNVYGEPCSFIDFDGIDSCREFIDSYSNMNDYPLYGMTNFSTQYMSYLKRSGKQKEPNLSVLKIGIIDIETKCDSGFPNIETANEQVLLITVRDKENTTVFSLSDFDVDENVVKKVYDNNEELMLLSFVEFLEEKDYDIITGWNIRFFDIPYLVNRIIRIIDEKTAKRLSPWGKIKPDTINYRGKDCQIYKISGLSVLDYYELYRKYTSTNQESYKLDNIGFVELGIKKLDYSEYESLKDFYEKNYNKFVKYNIQDVNIVDKLNEKLKLIDLQVSVAYTAGVNFEDVYSQIKTWDGIIYNHLLDKGMVIPQRKDEEKTKEYVGAFVKDPILGLHNWVVSFDLTSLYPHLIMQFNISPDTIVDYTKNVTIEKLLEKSIDMSDAYSKNYSVAANGQCFRNDSHGFLPELMEIMFGKRKQYKNKAIELKKKFEETGDVSLKNEIAKFDLYQLSMKIILNSLYGVCGNSYFRFYDLRIAEAITFSGQLAIRWIQNEVNVFLNKICKTENYDYVIASDTDSVTGDSIIYVNGKKIKIEDYYNKINTNNFIKNDKFNENYVKKIDNCDKSLSVSSSGKLEEKPIKYIMKHKVKKRMFRIKDSKGNSVVVTEDHSIIVRDKKTKVICSIKPNKLNPKIHEIINIVASGTDSEATIDRKI